MFVNIVILNMIGAHIMKQYDNPKFDFVEIDINDVILMSFIEEGHNIFDYDDIV